MRTVFDMVSMELSPVSATRVLAHAAIAELPLDQRTAFVLSHFSGLTYAEVAEITHTKVGTVASRKYAAVRTLQKKLSRSLGGLRNEVR